MSWTQEEAINICRDIEPIAKKHGAHIALTGGCLYKFGPRKDCDIIVYRIRQLDRIDHEGFFEELRTIGVEKISGFGWCHKAKYLHSNIDFLFPEEAANSEGYTR